MFSDAGPDVRWVGNERGYAGETNWSCIDAHDISPGHAPEARLNTGQREGASWIPAECDVSIRPGWFYHATENDKVKSVAELMEIYYRSVGRNGSMLLNLPPDRRGRIHENDFRRLMEFCAAREAAFGVDLARNKAVSVPIYSEILPEYGSWHLTDGKEDSCWCPSDGANTCSFTVHFDSKTKINQVHLREFILLGQRVEHYTIEAMIGREWQPLGEGTTIGNRRIVRFPGVSTDTVKVSITKSRACPVLKGISVYNALEVS